MGDVAAYLALSPEERCERQMIAYAKRYVAAYDAPVIKVDEWHKRASSALSNLRASVREHDRIIARISTKEPA